MNKTKKNAHNNKKINKDRKRVHFLWRIKQKNRKKRNK